MTLYTEPVPVQNANFFMHPPLVHIGLAVHTRVLGHRIKHPGDKWSFI